MVSTAPVPSRRDNPSGQSGRFYRLLLVHHTHWDREWWATREDFRARLVDLIDTLLDTLDRDPSFHNFLLDGQTIVLTDYLEIRPENRERLARYIREGRIECGPWYILPDEFLVSGESHIRNLWLGIRTGRALCVPLLRIGYIPDLFGHISQMPQILRGFDIDNAFVWRGRGGDPEVAKQEFVWQSPDGSRVLAHWFPNGYYQMPFLHFGNPDRPYEDKLGRIYQSMEDFGPRATTDVLLLPYGGDHRPVDPDLAVKIREVNAQIQGIGEVTWSTPDGYLAAVRNARPELEVQIGELRASGPDNPHVLPGVLSTRLYLKRLNAVGQMWLERFAEPMSALAWLTGARYDSGFLWRAWELLVQNHPHDSICGCSVDQVHREMIPRFDQSRQIGQVLAQRSAAVLGDRIDTSAFRSGDRALVAHNTLPWTRTGWAAIWIPRDPSISPRTHVLLDGTGAEVPFQVADVEGTVAATDRYFWTRIGFVAVNVPGAGYRTYRLREREIPLDTKQVFFNALGTVARYKGSESVSDLRIGPAAMENAYLRVDVDTATGGLTVTDKRAGQTYTGLNVFEDGGDAGDSYNYSQPLGDFARLSAGEARVHVSIAEAGFARCTLRVDLDWLLPESLTGNRLGRSDRDRMTRISTLVTVTSGVPRIDIETEWENVTRDHRLRALFPLGVRVNRSFASGDFVVEEYPVTVGDSGNGWPEPPVPTRPNSGWVAMDGDGSCLTIAARGLPEYEVLPDGTVALTILRAVGWVSREDLLSRAGGAGPTTPAPDAQCLGSNRASYSISPHQDHWLQSAAYREAESYLTPFYAVETGIHAGDAPLDGGWIELEGDHTLAMGAVKKAEDADALLVRVWNVAREPSEARLRLGRRPRAAWRTTLREEADGTLLPMDEEGRVIVSAGPAEIVTVLVEI
jgi:mannosylglycerate hydrolase